MNEQDREKYLKRILRIQTKNGHWALKIKKKGARTGTPDAAKMLIRLRERAGAQHSSHSRLVVPLPCAGAVSCVPVGVNGDKNQATDSRPAILNPPPAPHPPSPILDLLIFLMFAFA